MRGGQPRKLYELWDCGPKNRRLKKGHVAFYHRCYISLSMSVFHVRDCAKPAEQTEMPLNVNTSSPRSFWTEKYSLQVFLGPQIQCVCWHCALKMFVLSFLFISIWSDLYLRWRGYVADCAGPSSAGICFCGSKLVARSQRPLTEQRAANFSVPLTHHCDVTK